MDLISSDSDDDGPLLKLAPPKSAPVVTADDTDSSEERLAVLFARHHRERKQAAKLEAEQKTINSGVLAEDEDDAEEEDDAIERINSASGPVGAARSDFSLMDISSSDNNSSGAVILKPPAPTTSGGVDYSGLFDDEGQILPFPLHLEADEKREAELRKRKRQGLLNLKQPKMVKMRKQRAAAKGAALLKKDAARQKEVLQEQLKKSRKQLKEARNERYEWEETNTKQQRKDPGNMDFAAELEQTIGTRRMAIQLKDTKETPAKPKSKRRRQQSQPMEGDGMKQNALLAARALENAANIQDSKAKAAAKPKKKKKKTAPGVREIVNRRRKKITSAPKIVKLFGDLARMLVAGATWSDDNTQPREEDLPLISKIVEGANLFSEKADELGQTIEELCREFFELRKNTAMLKALTAFKEKTKEVHARPSLRKVPGKDGAVPNSRAIDIWTGERLTPENIANKACLVLRPDSEKNASACTLVAPKLVPDFLALVHGALHLSDYTQNWVKDSTAKIERADPALSWEKVWIHYAGEVLCKKPTFAWPKGATSNGSNPYTRGVVIAREFISAALFLEKELREAIEKEKSKSLA